MQNQHIGDVVRFHRKKAGLSQKSLADISGVGKTVVFDVEKGKETIRFNSLLKILNTLNIKIVFESPLMDKYLKSQNEKS